MKQNPLLRKFLFPNLILFCVILPVTAFTQVEYELPASSTRMNSEGDRNQEDNKTQEDVPEEAFSMSLGAGIVMSPRPYPGSNSRIIPIPSLELQYKRWFFQGIRGGYSFIQSGPLTANLFAQAQFKGLDPEDSPYLEGMAKRSPSMDAGLELVYSARPVGFSAGFISDTLGKNNGQELSFMAVTGAPLFGRGVILFSIGPRWLSQNRVDYYYGIRNSEATSSRLAYEAPATWNLDIKITCIVNVSTKWRIFALLTREGFGSGIEDSPIVNTTSTYSLISSLNYIF